ncbi:MAG: hypothetical protein KIC54_00470 [Clostridium sp.]|nr:hypothetical protein [Clostridium sp.]
MKNKKILIETDNVNEIYKKYKKYKAFIYKNTEFIYNGEIQEIKDIIEALNKKTRLQKLAYIYDKSCEQIDKKFEGENICGFQCNQCIAQRKHNLKEKNGCCRVCRLQTSTGCPSKNLTCKLFFCDEVKNKYEVITFKDLKLLKLLTRRQRLILKFDLFSTREEVLTDLYIGFVTIAAFRELYMLIKTSLFWILKWVKNKMKMSSIGKFVILMTLLMLIMFAIINPILPIIMICIGIIEDIAIRLFQKNLQQV